jgi:hypothetical protein
MLEQELEKLRAELPASVKAAIDPADVAFARQTIARQPRVANISRAARQAAAGIAWERALIAHVRHLTVEREEMCVVAERWKPRRVSLDLDVVVVDQRKAVVWILDAKLSRPTEEQIALMRRQIRLLRKAPDLTQGCPTVLGVIVHHRRQLPAPATGLAEARVLRCTLQRVGDLLLANDLPDVLRR